MKNWLRKRPWIWIVLLFVAVAAVNVIFVVIASRNAPVDVGEESRSSWKNDHPAMAVISP